MARGAPVENPSQGTWPALLCCKLLAHWCLSAPPVGLHCHCDCPAHSPLATCAAALQEDSDDESSHQGGAEIAAHMARYEPIKKALIIIEGNVTEVNALKAKNKNTATEKQRKGGCTAQLHQAVESLWLRFRPSCAPAWCMQLGRVGLTPAPCAFVWARPRRTRRPMCMHALCTSGLALTGPGAVLCRPALFRCVPQR